MIEKLNDFFQTGGDLFDIFGFIRLNMLYLNPTNLKNLKIRLQNLGLRSWVLQDNGLVLHFENESVLFQGLPKFTLRNEKMFGLELDFEPVVTSKSSFDILYELESYLKGLDAIFFMTYDVDIENEILNNPLSYSVEYLYRKVIKERNDDN